MRNWAGSRARHWKTGYAQPSHRCNKPTQGFMDSDDSETVGREPDRGLVDAPRCPASSTAQLLWSRILTTKSYGSARLSCGYPRSSSAIWTCPSSPSAPRAGTALHRPTLCRMCAFSGSWSRCPSWAQTGVSLRSRRRGWRSARPTTLPGFDADRYQANYFRLVRAVDGRVAALSFLYPNPWGEYGHEDHVQVHRAVGAGAVTGARARTCGTRITAATGPTL